MSMFFYQWAAKTLGENHIPKCNFHKYLINRQGTLVGAFDSKITPDAKELKDAIQQALAE